MLNHENIFSEIKFLICIHVIPSVKFVIFETNFAKVSSLEIFSHKNILSWGISNLTNVRACIYTQKHQKRYLIFAFSACYFYMICSNMSRNKGICNYVIKSILNWLDLISTFKKMANSNDRQRQFHFLSCLQFAKEKGYKAYVFENIFKIPWNM